jgi:hypothetical protein
MQVIRAASSKISIKILWCCKEKLNIFIMFDSLWINSCCILGKGIRASHVKIQSIIMVGKIEYVVIDCKAVIIDVLNVHLQII